MKYKKRGGKRHPRVIFSLKKSERRNFSKNAGGAVIRYSKGVSIRYSDGASIRYRALRIFRKVGVYKVQR